MAFQQCSKMFGLIWHHPIVSFVVVLLFTPPFFPIVVYFSPLLISTALFVLAMISMGSDHDDMRNYSHDIPFKRVWIEEVDVDGPNLDGERDPKRLKAASKDETWIDKMKSWEGTGQTWVESVLTHEARKRFGPDDIPTSGNESIPLFDKAREFFAEDVRKRSRESDVPKSSSRPIDEVKGEVNVHDSAPGVSEDKPESADDSGNRLVSSTNITPETESEEKPTEITSADSPPSPQLESKSLPKEAAAVDIAAELPTVVDAVSKTPLDNVDSVGTLKSTQSEDGKKIGFGSAFAGEKISSLLEAERAPAYEQSSSNVPEKVIPSDVSLFKEKNLLPKEMAKSTVVETQPEIEAAVRSGEGATVGDDPESATKVLDSVSTEGSGKSSMQSTEMKSEMKPAAELPAVSRQEQASFGLGTPSAAVALSEKLKVPLADMMSLLAGDDKDDAPNQEPSLEKASTSSETSQEEEWSSSEVGSPGTPTATRGPS